MATTIKALPKSYRAAANMISQGYVADTGREYLHTMNHVALSGRNAAAVHAMVGRGWAEVNDRGYVKVTKAGSAAMLLEGIGPLSSNMAQMLDELATDPYTKGYVKPGRVGYAKRRALVALKNRNMIFWNGAYWALNGAGDTALRAVRLVPWSWK